MVENIYFVYLEYQNEIIEKIGLQLLAKAYELALSTQGKVYGIVIGKHTQAAKEQLKGLPLTKVYLCETDGYFRANQASRICYAHIKGVRPNVVLFGGTKIGKSISSRLAVALRTGLTADCTELSMRDDELIQVRPAYGGNIIAQIVTPKCRPQMATVSYNLIPSLHPVYDVKTEFHYNEYLDSEESIVIDRVRILPKEKSITDYIVLVVAGLGVKKQEDLIMLRELAHLLGGELASTRGLVEKGWMPYSKQVGLSGQSIRVQLLITCGASGTVQFMAGVQRADTFIAINTDKDAQIFAHADYSYCGDLYTIIPTLINRLKS